VLVGDLVGVVECNNFFLPFSVSARLHAIGSAGNGDLLDCNLEDTKLDCLNRLSGLTSLYESPPCRDRV
jgi:hypothetical protein